MSKYFITDPPVPIYEFDPDETISDVQPNIIWIKARMDVETSGKVKNELFALDKDRNALELRAGGNEIGLLVHNIIRWEGPDFGQIPCTPENIRKMDSNQPHLAKVLEEIAKRNPGKESPNPKSPTANGSMSGGGVGLHETASPRSPAPAENLSLQLATGMPRSPLRSALDGHLNKLDDLTRTT